MPDEEIPSKRIPIVLTYPPDLQTHFVTYTLVQHEREDFIVSFFELWPPPILGETEEEKRQEFEKLTEVEAKCVARIVLSPGRMKTFIEDLSDNYNKWQQRTSTEAGEEGMQP
jgi:hypothetical protein